MIPRSLFLVQRPDGQSGAEAPAFTDLAELLGYLQLPAELAGSSPPAASDFPLRVPRHFAALMKKGDPCDPLLRQVLPVEEEQREAAGFSADPVGDHAALTKTAGVMEKYHGRSLLITTGACAIHCRYCFRRHFPYGQQSALRDDWQQAIRQLQQSRPSEVILSGGDPLSLSNPRLASLLEQLGQLPFLRRIRFHSRYPLVEPQRVDAGLMQLLRNCQKSLIMVVHSNHPNELDPTVGAALHRLREAGCRLFNQSVLLKGVNDRAETLAELSEALFSLGVQPYYLHQMDRVQGASHFEVPRKAATQLYARLLELLPGYLVPRWVEEVPGAPSKLPVNMIKQPQPFV
jgi:EF-P beta-lysylation protein EpmB